MSVRTAQVRLGRLVVGQLLEADDDAIEFVVDPDYGTLKQRPVLGQWFEDRRRTSQHGERPGALPPFFANLIPEGDLKLTLMDRLGIAYDDDFGLLCAVGGDLPGALAVELVEGTTTPRTAASSEPPRDDDGLRFSLAGVQLKFSMVRGADRFHMPGRDQHGGWIAKISYERFPDLAANEWTTMEWARGVGFDVPRTELRRLAELVGIPHDGAADAQVFLIERYDRGLEAARTHQEDFQQVVGRRPNKKYDDMTYDKLALLAARVIGGDAYAEFIRRLAFVVASGNNDAHMKNWSVIYPDGITPQWSPLYDQVFTARWPEYARAPALKIDGAREFAEIDLRHFRVLAERIGESAAVTEELVATTVARATLAWREVREHPNVTPEYRDALRRHWQRTPLLRPHALLI